MSIKHVIFDLGAVMFDWNPEKITENFTNDIDLRKQILTELYYHQDWKDFDCAVITEKEAIRHTSNKFNLSLADSEKLFEQTKKSLALIPETLEFLKKVKEKNLNAYCLSNISPELFQYLFEKYDLFKLFDGIVTSGEENIGKPDKRIFEILFDRYNLNPQQCLFIDDSATNTEAAKKLGITSITFKGSADCYKKIYSFI